MTGRARRRAWITILTLASLTNQFSVNLVRPASTYKVDAMGGDAAVVGVVAATYALIPLVTAMPLGRLTQRLGSLSALMAGGLAIMAIGAGVIAASPAVWGIILGMAGLGFGQLVFTIGGQSAVSRVTGDATMDAGFGWFTAGVSAGQMLGPLAAGWIISTADSGAEAARTAIDLSIWFGAAATIPAVGVLLVIQLTTRGRPGTHHRSDWGRWAGTPPAEKASVLQILRRPRVAAHVFASAGLLALTDILAAFLPLLGENVGLSPEAVGALLAIRGLGSLASRTLLGYLTNRMRRDALLIGSLVISSLGFAALPAIVSSFWLAACLMFAGGFFLGIGQPLTMSMITLLVPVPWRSPALALRLVGNRLGQVVIPLAAGTVAAPLGPGGAVWMGSAILVVSAIEQTWHRWKHQ